MKVIGQDKGETMREQFEKLPEIAERLKVGDVYWNDETQSYKFTGGTYRRATYINGAWYAYQEQQKKIDELYDSYDQIVDELVVYKSRYGKIK